MDRKYSAYINQNQTAHATAKSNVQNAVGSAKGLYRSKMSALIEESKSVLVEAELHTKHENVKKEVLDSFQTQPNIQTGQMSTQQVVESLDKVILLLKLINLFSYR